MDGLTQDVFDALPEQAQSAFEKQGDVYVTVDSLKVSSLKEKLNGAFGERDSATSKLNEYTSAEADKIEAAAQLKYEKAIAENDFETQNQIKQEKLDDALRRAEAAEGKYSERLNSTAKEQEAAIIAQLSKHAKKGGEAGLKRLLRDYVKVDPETGQETYLNDDGSASSLNREQFIIEQLNNNPIFTPLVMGKVTTQSPGIVNGGHEFDVNGGGIPATLEACKGDRKLEALYFNNQMRG